MSVEEIAKQICPNSEDSFFHFSDQDIFVFGFKEGYKYEKPKVEALECPFCNSKDIKWAFRLVKQCKNCNEYFNSKS